MKRDDTTTILMIVIALGIIWLCVQQIKSNKQQSENTKKIARISEAITNLVMLQLLEPAKPLWHPADFAALPRDKA
jgi:hypothetical protein